MLRVKETLTVLPWKAGFVDFQHQVDEMFEDLCRRWAISPQLVCHPPLDLRETEDAYVVEIDLPGVAPEEVHIAVSERKLCLAGERRPTPLEGEIFNRCERKCGAFRRTLDLPQPVDAERARAEFHHGTYRIHLPKKRAPKEEAKETILQITVASSQ